MKCTCHSNSDIHSPTCAIRRKERSAPASCSARREALRAVLKKIDRMIAITTQCDALIDADDSVASNAVSDVQVMLWNSRGKIESAIIGCIDCGDEITAGARSFRSNCREVRCFACRVKHANAAGQQNSQISEPSS